MNESEELRYELKYFSDECPTSGCQCGTVFNIVKMMWKELHPEKDPFTAYRTVDGDTKETYQRLGDIALTGARQAVMLNVCQDCDCLFKAPRDRPDITLCFDCFSADIDRLRGI